MRKVMLVAICLAAACGGQSDRSAAEHTSEAVVGERAQVLFFSTPALARSMTATFTFDRVSGETVSVNVLRASVGTVGKEQTLVLRLDGANDAARPYVVRDLEEGVSFPLLVLSEAHGRSWTFTGVRPLTAQIDASGDQFGFAYTTETVSRPTLRAFAAFEDGALVPLTAAPATLLELVAARLGYFDGNLLDASDFTGGQAYRDGGAGAAIGGLDPNGLEIAAAHALARALNPEIS
jgi:hypothetical protein